MSEFWKSVLTAFGMAAKDASPDELESMVDTAVKALDAAPAENAQEAEPANPEPAPAEKEEPPTEEGADAVEEGASNAGMDAKLDRILDLLTAQRDDKSEKEESSIDAAIDRLCAGDRSVVIPAGDTALNVLKVMRPVVAAIEDKATRARVSDALVASLAGESNTMEKILSASQAGAQKAADAARKTTYETICAESEAAYAERNPHKTKKEG